MKEPEATSLDISEEEYCKPCNMNFKTYNDLFVHKLMSNLHIVCSICGQELKTREGLKRHYYLLHTEEQDLNCPGCNHHFTRVGGLIGHLELRQCPVISAQDFRTALEIKQEFQEQLKRTKNATTSDIKLMGTYENKSVIGRYEDEPVAIRDNWTDAGSLDGRAVNITLKFTAPVDEDEDLLCFDSPVKRDGWEEADLPDSITQKPAPKINFEIAIPKPTNDGNGPINLAELPSMQKRAVHTTASIKDFPPLSRSNIARAAVPMTPNSTSVKSGSLMAMKPATQQHPAPVKAGWSSEIAVLRDAAPYDPALLEVPVHMQNLIPAQAILQAESKQYIVPVRSAESAPLQAVTKQNIVPGEKVTKEDLVTKQNVVPIRPAVSTPLEMVTQQNIVPIQPTVPTPMESVTYLAHDPDAPEFHIGKYWNNFLQKYQCPHPGCGKSLPTPGGFKQHLKSAAHLDGRLQCQGCFRYFGTATALTQHSESQGLRCNIRHSANYSFAVDKFTAGVTTTNGRHADNTVRYAVNQVDLRNAAELFAQANRDEIARQDEYNRTYWDNRRPDW